MSITVERYGRLRGLLEEALALEDAARAELVERECGGDSEMRGQLERLLRATIAIETGQLVQAASGAPALELGELPREFGPYVLEEELGRGGMGVVFAARDPRLERRVALKILDLGGAVAGSSGERARQVLREEARNLAALAHPHIAMIHTLEEIEGYSCVTLELIDGVSLADKLADGALPAAESLRIAHQLCGALEAAHRAGIIHLDLKPANVMLTRDGRVKVLDFGIARRLRPDEDTVGLGGTLGYMSPEQAVGATVDERADLWGLGCVVFECFSGTPAIGGGDLREVLDRTLQGQLDWTALPADLPRDLDYALRRCLEPDPGVRPRSVTEFARAVEAAIGVTLSGLRRRDELVLSEGLPEPRRELLGRDELIAESQARLGDTRLVTLVGAGGCGKTHLALEVARRTSALGEKALWVDLGAVAAAPGVLEAVARATGTPPGGSPEAAVLRGLSQARALLVLDNAEHLIIEVARVAELIRSRCLAVRVLVTSREELGIAQERVVPVPPLPLPDGDPQASAAVQLFARCAEPHGFQLDDGNAQQVASLVRRLDGIPLAIELAAGRMRLLSLGELSARLEDRFRLLAGGDRLAPARQQTLVATLDWSHDLLDDDEHTLFRRLAVFVDGWTLRAAEEVCADDDLPSWSVLDSLSSLTAKSLVFVRAVGDEMRYQLFETVRAYALAKLADAGEEPLLRRRFFEHAADETARAAERIGTSDPGRWVHAYDVEHANLIAALTGAPPEVDRKRVLAALADLWPFWRTRGTSSHGVRLLRDALAEFAPGELDDAERANAEHVLAALEGNVGDYRSSVARMDQAIELYRRVANAVGLAGALAVQSRSLVALGEHDRARELLEEATALRRSQDDPNGLGQCLGNLGTLERERGNLERAFELFEEVLRLARAHGNKLHEAGALSGLALTHSESGELDRARQRYEEAAELYRDIGDEAGLSDARGNLAQLSAEEGDYERARELHLEVLEQRRALGITVGQAVSLVNLVPIAVKQGDLEAARDWLLECLDLIAKTGEQRVGAFALEAGVILARALDDERAGVLRGASRAHRERIGVPGARKRAASAPADDPAKLEEGRQFSFEQALELARAVATGAR